MQHRIENNTTIERTHRTEKMKRGGGTVNNKRTIVVRFLCYKDSKSNLTKNRGNQLWNHHSFIDEDFMEETINI